MFIPGKRQKGRDYGEREDGSDLKPIEDGKSNRTGKTETRMEIDLTDDRESKPTKNRPDPSDIKEPNCADEQDGYCTCNTTGKSSESLCGVCGLLSKIPMNGTRGLSVKRENAEASATSSACPTCTYLNEADAKKCEMCNAQLNLRKRAKKQKEITQYFGKRFCNSDVNSGVNRDLKNIPA